MSANLLVELFTEELPPKALSRLGQAFANGIRTVLVERGLVENVDIEGGTDHLKVFATPRRLAVKIAGVLECAPDRTETKKLMPVKVAYSKDGPTPALLKRLEKEGFPAGSFGSQIKERLQEREGYVFFEQTIPGLTLVAALQIALEEAISNLPMPKVMNYQLADGTTTVHFVRPAHGLVALHGAEIVPVSVLGLVAGRVTHGHRFQGVKDISVATADAYEEALTAHGNVIASFDERRSDIARQLANQTAVLKASLGPEADYVPLLEEVTALVEHPTVYVGEFESEFLAVPPECLVLTMRQNQKYFPLFNTAGKLINKFLIVSNMRLADPKNVVEGNQRVVRPRLADARFFFETDKKTRLEDRVPQLAQVVYHNKLGSQFDRVERVKNLTGAIARMLNVQPENAQRAAQLAKADLTTNMVAEFPELQGTMGQYYAADNGEPDEVARAIAEHYQPRFAGDKLPETTVGTILALADKLETLAGMFSIGQQPTGDKDPYALRRHALGVVRILVDRKLGLSLDVLLGQALDPFWKIRSDQTQTELADFILDRVRSYLREQGYSANEIDAVISLRPPRIDQVPARIEAVRAFASMPEAESLASANKRIGNILKKAGSGSSAIDSALLSESAEKVLAEALARIAPEVNSRFNSGDYAGSLKLLAQMKQPVDTFFDEVMVMADDLKLRTNRIALLHDLHRLMNQVADISKLAA